jgi:phospholipid/cholesterol/gamma-HCH transport system substrate-binding protein
MGDQIKNMLVGLLMIAACAFTISLILFLKPSVGDGRKTYIARFSNINGIGIGTRVMFAGKPVGEVVDIDEVSNARKQPYDKSGQIFFYQLTLKVDSSVTIFNTDSVGIQTSGLLGEKSITIIPRVPRKGVVPKPIGKEPIYADSADPLEKALNELSDLAMEMEGTFKFVNDWLLENRDNMTGALTSFRSTMDEASKTLTSVNESKIVESAKEGVDEFALAMKRIQSSIKVLQDGQLFENANKIVADISTGKGTIGKLIVEDNMYLQLSALLSKGNTMMNDINHYGILFHLNKTWKRQRLQKVSMINSLDSPQSFENFFQEQIDDINMAMSRLSMVMQRAETLQTTDNVLHNKAFTKDFAQLLKDVDNLSSNLKLYNEQLQEAQ